MIDYANPSASQSYSQLRWTGLARVVRPTLIVAIGGTGSSAAKTARSRIEALLGTGGPSHHYIAFRALDTAYQDNREPRFVDNSEFVYLGGFNAQAVIADIVAGDAYPHWAQWLPPRLNFQQVAFGAGGIRPIGRLCYFYRRDQVEAAVQEALTTITDADLAMRFHQQTGVRINLEAGIDIHVICSVCGGTGSGMFLDLAFDLRRWAEEHTDREVTVTGHLVLPEAFRRKPVVLKALEANAYVALQELDRFMNANAADPWTVEHVQGRPEPTWRPPFDHCYLLSGLQQGGTTDIDTLTSVIGEAVTLLTYSQVGQKVSEGVVNMAGQRKSTRDERGRLCCYSSYGVLGLEIPWHLLGESLGPELASQVRERLVGQDWYRGEDPDPEIESFRQTMRFDSALVESLVPIPDIDRTIVAILLHDEGSKSPIPGGELQGQLRRARDRIRQQLRQLESEEPWPARDLRAYLTRKVEEALNDQRKGGLAGCLRFLDGGTKALQEFAGHLREIAREAKNEAERLSPVAESVERGNLVGKSWERQIWPEVDEWDKQLRAASRARLFEVQAVRIEELADWIQRRLIARWQRIQLQFSDLRLPEPRDEESFYGLRRALASICPLSFFREILGPKRDGLVDRVLARLVKDSERWAESGAAELAARFSELCTEAIRDHFAGEAGIEWDNLLQEYHRGPSARYETQINVFLQRAQANWELGESYALRTNRLEISAVGARSDSHFYQSLERSHHQISSVEEQRRDHLPIFRTEHGLSLIGIKRLDAYRASLLDSIVEEQRYDLHFFLDRRWIARMEFAGEHAERQRQLSLFSSAEMLGLIERRRGTGYVVGGEPALTLGEYRFAAFKSFIIDQDTQRRFSDEIQKRRERTQWDNQLRRHIETLRRRIDEALQLGDGDRAAIQPRYLSLDVFQIHEEIRALLAELEIEEKGI